MKVVKSKVLSVAILTLGLTSCGASHNFLNDQIWTRPGKYFNTHEQMVRAFESDKKVCEQELHDIMPGVYNDVYASGSYAKCLVSKGWKSDRPIFGAARKMNERFPD